MWAERAGRASETGGSDRIWQPLKLAAGWDEAEVNAAFDVCRNTAKRVRARFLEGGVDAVLTDKPQGRRRQALSGAQQAHLIALAGSAVPEGHDHWTLRLLAGQAVELGFVACISPETIRALLRGPHHAGRPLPGQTDLTGLSNQDERQRIFRCWEREPTPIPRVRRSVVTCSSCT